MFYVKLDVTEVAPARLIEATGADYLQWGHVFIPGEVSDDDASLAAARAVNCALPENGWSIVHEGDLSRNHDEAGRTVRWVWWLNEHYVGNILYTTQPVYIVNENGKTLDRV